MRRCSSIDEPSGLGSGPCSNSSTSWPLRARAQAVARPMIPPPTMMIFMATLYRSIDWRFPSLLRPRCPDAAGLLQAAVLYAPCAAIRGPTRFVRRATSQLAKLDALGVDIGQGYTTIG